MSSSLAYFARNNRPSLVSIPSESTIYYLHWVSRPSAAMWYKYSLYWHLAAGAAFPEINIIYNIWFRSDFDWGRFHLELEVFNWPSQAILVPSYSISVQIIANYFSIPAGSTYFRHREKVLKSGSRDCTRVCRDCAWCLLDLLHRYTHNNKEL